MLIVIIKGVPHIKNLKWNQKKKTYFPSLLTMFSLVLKKTSSFSLVG